MIHGYPLVKTLCSQLQDFMAEHGFESISDFRGKSLPYFTTHTHLAELQQAAIGKRREKKMISNDKDWTGEGFVQQSQSMVSNS